MTKLPKQSRHQRISKLGKPFQAGSGEKLLKENDYLYHATYRPLLNKIKKEGLQGGKRKNYEDSATNKVYLDKTPEGAESYAETSDTIPEEWLDQIVILKIPKNKLNKKLLNVDKNVLQTDDEEAQTFEYSDTISPQLLSEYKKDSEKMNLNKSYKIPSSIEKSSKLSNTILPFPRMIMQPPKEGAVDPIMKLPNGRQITIKLPKEKRQNLSSEKSLPKALSSKPVKVNKLPLQGEIISKSLLPKIIKPSTTKAWTGKKSPTGAKKMPGISRSGKVSGATGTGIPKGTSAPSKTGQTGSGERAGHKYVKREGTPGAYKYWYRLPNGKLGTKKQLNEAVKQKESAGVKGVKPVETVKKKPIEKPSKLPSGKKEVSKLPKAKEVTPKIETKEVVPEAYNKIFPTVPKEQKAGMFSKVKDVLGNIAGKIKDFVNSTAGKRSEEQEDALTKEVQRLYDMLYMMSTLDKFMVETKAGKKIAKEFKFSKEKIDSMNSITDLDNLMNEAKDPEKPQAEQVVHKIQKRINFLSKLEADQQDEESKKKFQKDVEIVSDPKNRVSASTIKKVQISPSAKIKSEVNKASSDYLLKLVNKKRTVPFKTADDYFNHNKKLIESTLKKTSDISKGYVIDPKTGIVTFSDNKKAEEAAKQLRKYKTVIFRDSEDPKTLKKQIVFSKVGDESILSPMNSSYLDAAQAIANKSKNGSSTAWVPLGFDGKTFTLKPSDGSEDAETSSLTFAMPGVGKSVNIRGTTLASLMGNPEGTYKAVIVDPSSSIFTELDKNDSELTPEERTTKATLQHYTDKGLLTIITPKSVTGKDELGDDNSRQFMEAVLDKINKDRTLQTARRTSQNLDNLASSSNVEPTVHYQIDELNKMALLNIPKDLKEKFGASLSAGINDTARKGKMIFHGYGQSPEGLSDSIKGANWKRIESMGRANDRVIASTFKIKGGPEMIRRTPENGIISIDRGTGGTEYFQKPVGGSAVEGAMAQTPVSTKSSLPKAKINKVPKQAKT